MAKDPFEQFAMPKEMLTFVEQGVTQARNAFNGFVAAANQAMGHLDGHAEAARSGVNEVAQKSIAYAEQNMSAAFEFAEKLMKAGDAGEVMRLQSEYLSRQMRSLSAQAQDLGQSAAKMVVDAGKPKA